MLIAAVLVLLAPLAVILLLAAFKPATFRVERRTTVQASAGTVFASLEDFHRWVHWSPWEGLDPALQRTYSGPAVGQGAVYAWEGNKKVGAGRMEIVESTPPSRLVVKLDFLRPWEAHNTVEFSLTPAAGGTTDVVWAMSGPQPFSARIFSVVMPMEKLVGRDFEKGLSSLKRISEAGHA